MPTNYVFLAIHFVISKCMYSLLCISSSTHPHAVYANSLLATYVLICYDLHRGWLTKSLPSLNTRKQLQRGGSMRSLGVRTHDRALPVVLSEDIGPDRRHAFLDRFTVSTTAFHRRHLMTDFYNSVPTNPGSTAEIQSLAGKRTPAYRAVCRLNIVLFRCT
jgi:hypothetical protein